MRKPRALVTGANRGLGLEVAKQLAELGHPVVLTGRDAHALAEAARSVGHGAEALVLDVADLASVERAARETGRVDILVNNAGVALDEGSEALDVDDDTIRATLETNLLGAWRMCRAFVPPMVERRWGRVVNVSSGAGALSEIGGYSPSYSVSKAALNALTRYLAQDIEGSGVKVNSVCPGWVRTEMGGRRAPRSVEVGARGIVWAATIPDDGPTNGFFRDGRPIEW